MLISQTPKQTAHLLAHATHMPHTRINLHHSHNHPLLVQRTRSLPLAGSQSKQTNCIHTYATIHPTHQKVLFNTSKETCASDWRFGQWLVSINWPQVASLPMGKEVLT